MPVQALLLEGDERVKIKLRDRFAHFAANWILVHFTSVEYLAALYEVNRLGLIEYKRLREEGK